MDTKMFFSRREQPISESFKDILIRLSEKVAVLEGEVKNIKDNLQKLEIKALESRRVYHKKLQNLFGDEEKKSESNLKPSVFLSPNGDTI